MKKRDLLFTFDYELFLGQKSGSVDNCMIIPTKKVVEILESFHLKGIFFVDCTYLFQLKSKVIENPKAAEDFKKIADQIQKLISNNHDIYPHIHSHWQDAKYDAENNQWDLTSIDKYRFNSLTDEEKKQVFRDACDCLLDIIRPVKSDYQFEGYRAGGWCIQPFNDFQPFFREYNIEADFSVLGGSMKNSNALRFDFTSIETNATPYYFNENETEKLKEGEFIQYPISSLEINKNGLLNKLVNKILWRTKHGYNLGDGQGVPFKSNIKNTRYDDTMEMVSIELLTLIKLGKYKSYLKENNYMQFISHPKMLSPHNLLMLSKFLSFSSKKYSLNSDWKKIEL